jgi:hypothetical protein
MNTETTVLALIKDHIRHTRLTSGLHEIGLETDTVVTGLGNTILNMMDIKDGDTSDDCFNDYLGVIGKITTFGRDEWEGQIEPLANEAYTLLEGFRG